MIVQFLIQRTDIEIYIRMLFFHTLNTFRCCDNAYKTDMLYAFIFQHLNRCHTGTACCKHRICYNNSSFLNWMWKLAVIWYRLMCLFITVHSNMSNLSCWYK